MNKSNERSSDIHIFLAVAQILVFGGLLFLHVGAIAQQAANNVNELPSSGGAANSESVERIYPPSRGIWQYEKGSPYKDRQHKERRRQKRKLNIGLLRQNLEQDGRTPLVPWCPTSMPDYLGPCVASTSETQRFICW